MSRSIPELSMRPRQILTVAMVLGLTVAGFFGARMLGERDAQRDSHHRAELAAAQIRERVEQGSSLAESLRRFMASVAGTQITGGEFESNASRWLGPAGFPTAAWVEEVPAARRAAYERRIGHPIVTRDPRLRIVPVGPQPSYLPATLVSGTPPVTVPGIDLGNEPGVVAAVTRASGLYEASATPLATLRDGSKGLFLIRSAPRFTKAGVEPGFVMLFVSELSLRTATTDTVPLQLTVGGTSAGDLGGAAAVHSTFTKAGQRFDVAAPQESVHGAAAFLPWIILAAGLVLAALAGVLGVNAARRAKAQDELDRIFHLSSDLIAVADFEGRPTRVNPAVKQILGFTEEEFLARPYLELIHPDDREKTVVLADGISQGGTVTSFENRFVRKDGSYRVLEWTSTPVLEERTMYGVARDVTERRRAESELRRLAGEQAALRRVATLVARGVPPAEVFAAVAVEGERLLDAQATTIGRLEPDGAMAIVASSGSARDLLPVGSRLKLESGLALTMVVRTGRPARVDDFSHVSESVERRAQHLGIRSSVAVPIMVGGALWGAIGAGTDREQFPADAEQRMTDFTELLATAIANADSRAELAASRRRIVAASDAARRRIERDLHDGTQQQLVSLVLDVRAEEANIPPERHDLRVSLSRFATGLAAAIDDLQEISRGIHPAILSAGGLGPALRTLARRSAIPVELDVTTKARLPEPIEVAAYFVASEALANATKHARASHIEVSLALHEAGLMLSIRDDGVGGADSSRGSGLVGLQDRVEALGGTIRIDSPDGGGTSLVVTLPFDIEPPRTETGGTTE
ncbi:PAS domain S-box protein [Streptomyces sp. NPDC087263]|uniref:PAS domain S-box protein n=1 Tax=Streptomyces sp. NPDC087263 TaxID=3365773 RepID=UPI00380D3521